VGRVVGQVFYFVGVRIEIVEFDRVSPNVFFDGAFADQRLAALDGQPPGGTFGDFLGVEGTASGGRGSR
jgi:hypothetical protein